jgi:hypothetical protein
MTFLSSIWLLALIPWGGFTLWMLVGRRRRQWVPFLALWDAPEEIRKPKKGFEPPPLALVLALLALLLGVLAMSQPRFTPGAQLDHGRITLIVDRGASMSALVQGQPRYAALAEDVAPVLLQKFGRGSVDLVDVVSGGIQSTDRSAWAGQVKQWKQTALDTSQLLNTTIAQRLQKGQPVIVLSDRDIGITRDQLLQVKPKAAVHNAGIVALAYRPGQVMASLASTDAASRRLRVTSGTKSTEQLVTLKPDRVQSVFLDLDAPADTIEAVLAPDPQAPDDFQADDHAWLARRQSAPIIEPRTALGEELRRVISVYARHRPASESSPKLSIARPGELKADESGILLAPVLGTESPIGDLSTRPHPILTGLSDWRAISAGASLAASEPGEGWTKIVWQGGRTLVAIREGEVRQVWIGFESREFSRTPAFVIFWTNVFDWAGGGVKGFTASQVAQSATFGERIAPEQLSENIDARNWPGLFESDRGRFAFNSGPVRFGHGSADWASALSSLHLPPGNGTDLAPWLAIGALLSVLGAAATWEMRRRATQGTALNRAVA